MLLFFLPVVGRVAGVPSRYCPKAVGWNEPQNNTSLSPSTCLSLSPRLSHVM